MKKVIIAGLLSTLTFAAFADNARDTYYTSGYTIGLNLGESFASLNSNAPYSTKTGNFAGRLSLGYNINPYFSLELGYAQFGNSEYVQDSLPTVTLKEHDIDALVGFHFPIGEGFSGYAKAGGALLYANQSTDLISENQNGTVLAYSAGLDYSFANIGGLHAVLDWYHTDPFNTNTFDIPLQNLFSVGVYYQF